MAEKNSQNRRGYAPLVISFSSGKGGVGKTSLSVNLAVYFSSKGKKVLLVDGDLGLANVDIMFGLKTEYNFHHLVNGEKNVEDILLKGPGGIHILPASSGINEMADLNADAQMMILSQLETLENKYDVILIDTAAGIGSSVLHFAASAQYKIIIVTPEPTSLADSYAVIKVLRQKYNVRRFQLVINSAQHEAGALKVYQTLSDVADNFIDVVLDYLGFIPKDDSVSRAITSQRPFVEMFPSAQCTRAIKTLGESLLAKRVRAQHEDSPILWDRILD